MQQGDKRAEWRPSHMGIRGMTWQIKAAQNSAGRTQVISIPYRDWIPNLKRRMYELWA